MPPTLVIGNKNYSSWSLRPWLAMRAFGIPFEEELIVLDRPDTHARILARSPAARVPVLLDGDTAVWESLAIIETLAERFPDKGLWPSDPMARAHARAISSEMHAGFAALRGHFPMNVRRDRAARREPTPEAARDIARIEDIWTGARRRFGAGGDFLFGAFSAADCMFAPVVWRFHAYGIPAGDAAARYMEAMLAHPGMREWEEAARAEPWVVHSSEV